MEKQILTIFGLSLAATATATYNTQAQGNVLVVVADDLGREVLSLYNSPTKLKAKTPNIDRLAARGVTFENLWGYPLSAPVRAAMLTGRYGHDTGIVALNINLPASEQSIFDTLPESYANSLIGKWHLSQDEDFGSDYGIDHFAGFYTEGGVRNYYRWKFTEDGVSTPCGEYVTTKITDSALEWIEKQSKPWFCWVAYTAPHVPLHLPPSHMHSQKKLKDSAEAMERDPVPYYIAMVESLDYDLGRLLEGVDDNTTVIFIGDNGTDNQFLQSPYPARHGKNSLYETGVGIPMIVSGGVVSQHGTRSDALVTAIDIFPTIAELSGVSMPRYGDSYSFLGELTGESRSERRYLFSEILHIRMGYQNAVSDGRYKLITSRSGEEILFDLELDPYEQNDLMRTTLKGEIKSALEELRAERDSLEIDYSKIPEKVTGGGDPRKRGGQSGGGQGGGGTRMGGNRQQGGGVNNNNFNNNFNRTR